MIESIGKYGDVVSESLLDEGILQTAAGSFNQQMSIQYPGAVDAGSPGERCARRTSTRCGHALSLCWATAVGALDRLPCSARVWLSGILQWRWSGWRANAEGGQQQDGEWTDCLAAMVTMTILSWMTCDRTWRVTRDPSPRRRSPPRASKWIPSHLDKERCDRYRYNNIISPLDGATDAAKGVEGSRRIISIEVLLVRRPRSRRCE